MFSSFLSCPPYFSRSSIFLLTLSLLMESSLRLLSSSSLSLRTPLAVCSSLSLSLRSSSLSAGWEMGYRGGCWVHVWVFRFRCIAGRVVRSACFRHFPGRLFIGSFGGGRPWRRRSRSWVGRSSSALDRVFLWSLRLRGPGCGAVYFLFGEESEAMF